MAVDIFTAVKPRDDVLAGTLSDAIFAASLQEVVAGTAPDAYGQPEAFFAATHPTGGLKTVLDETLGRLGGGKADAAPVIRLETNLGGGKTHNLIALYHAARGALYAAQTEGFADPALLLKAPVDQLGVFVGTAAGATSFPERDGVKPRTPWGHLALQLGGRDAFERIREDDEKLTAPGSDDLKDIFAGKPTLILLDELARYLTTADGVEVGRKTLADQTVAFLMALMEAAAGEPHTSVVVTMTETTDPFGGDTQRVVDAFEDAAELIGRRSQALRPSDEADLPRILARRLFTGVDDAAAGQVAALYAEAARDAYARGTDLPERLTQAGWQAEVERTYPFHPDLIRVLDKRLATIPNFQRTRGALRLLARGVRRLWDAKLDGTQLIHLHHLDLGDSDIAEDLSSRLDRPKWEPVIRADIASRAGGEPAHAEEVDRQMGSPYAKRLATAAYLYSLTAEVPGVSAPELIGSVLTPGDDPGIVTKAVDQLEESCWYLHTDVRGYRFSTEPSLVAMIQQTERRIPLGKVKQAATDILARQFTDSALKVRRTWEDAKVPDHADDAYLVLLHWDELQVADPSESPPAKIQELWEKTPAGGNRSFRNRLVFLAPSQGSHDAMQRAVRRHLALKDLAGSDIAAGLSPEKRQELKNRAGESELEARVAVCNHVNVLYVPESGGLAGYQLDVVTQASVKKNQTDAILDRLAGMEKTLAAGDKPLDPHYIRSKLGAQLDSSLPTEELVRVFARRSDLKLVLDKAMLRTLVADGIRTGAWDYQDVQRGDSGWATKDRPDAAVRIADDTLLHPPGSAPAPAPLACPLCGQIHEGACPGTGDGGFGGDPPPPPPASTFEAEGAAGVAVAAARQAAIDADRQDVRRLRVEITANGQGTGQQLTRLHTLVPATQSGASVRYELEATADLDNPGDRIAVTFSGPPTDYQALKSGVEQSLKTRPAVLRAAIDADFDPPLALSGQEIDDLQRRAAETGPGGCTVRLVTEEGT